MELFLRTARELTKGHEKNEGFRYHMAEIRIESATILDLPELTELLVELFTQETEFRPNREAHTRGLRLILENPNRGRIFVARDNGTLLGMINLLFTISTTEGGFVLLLEDLVVHPAHRHLGIGSMLLQHGIQFAKEKHFLRITLLADRVDHESARFFRKNGFQASDMVPMRLLIDTNIHGEAAI